MKPMFAEVDYTIGPIQKDAVWNGVLQADSMWSYPDKDSYQNVLSDVVENYSKYEEKAAKLKDLGKELSLKQKNNMICLQMQSSLEKQEEKEEDMLVSFD